MATTEEKNLTTPSAADTQAASSANTKSYADSIKQQYDAYTKQKEANIDYQTEYRATQAQRQHEDAVSAYQKQYRNLTTNMYQAMDNQALSSAANGQRGGMATRSVAATQQDYQAQRQALSLQQQKLATDTAREIEDLRAQGEFDKADALLEARQLQFQQLYADAVRVDENLYANSQYQTALEREDAAIQREQERYDTSISREDAAIQREQEQYNTSISREDAAIQREQTRDDTAYARSLGMMFLQRGIVPPDSILNLMGLEKSSAQSLANQIKAGY